MLPKLMLVVLLLGKNGFDVQYVVQYPTEAACQAEAKRIEDDLKRLHWYDTGPFKRAQCTFNLTK